MNSVQVKAHRDFFRVSPDRLRLRYEFENDVVEIEGIRYEGDIFRQFGRLLPLGEPFVIDSRGNGDLCIRKYTEVQSNGKEEKEVETKKEKESNKA